MYGREALEQLIQLCTSQEHLHKTAVILAGYKAEMDRMLSSTNPGLRSRFTNRLEFKNWTPNDCAMVIEARSTAKGLGLDARAMSALRAGFAEFESRKDFANARDAGLVFDLMYKARAKRVVRAEEMEGDGADQFIEADALAAVAELRRLRPLEAADPTHTAALQTLRDLPGPPTSNGSWGGDAAEGGGDNESGGGGGGGSTARGPRSSDCVDCGRGGCGGCERGEDEPIFNIIVPRQRVRERTREAAAEDDQSGGTGDGPSLEEAFAALEYTLDKCIAICDTKTFPDEVPHSNPNHIPTD